MRKETVLLWEQSEYKYPLAGKFIPKIISYIHEADHGKRPCIIIVPGGGYCYVSPSESEPAAMEFYDRGYSVFVCIYTADLTKTEPLHLQPLKDLSRAVRYVRKEAKRFFVNENQIVICGFSAGGHLCASLCVHYMDIAEENPVYADCSNRPDAAILSYPVITNGEYAHKESFRALLGENATQEELEYMSVEKHVTKDTPPCFIWHTADDDGVPVENSYLFAKACKEQEIAFAHHVFSHGRHGLSVANEAFWKGRYGEIYSIEQMIFQLNIMKENGLEIPERAEQLMNMVIQEGQEEITDEKPNEEVAVWPELADRWLKSNVPFRA